MLVYFGENTSIVKAKALVDEMFGPKRQMLIDAILDRKKFDFSTAPASELAMMITKYWDVYKTEIVLYKTKWPWSKTLAYCKDEKRIYLNSRKLNRSIESIAGTIAHELVHAADNAYPNIRCGHGSNDAHNKDGSFPYWFGYYVANILRKGK